MLSAGQSPSSIEPASSDPDRPNRKCSRFILRVIALIRLRNTASKSKTLQILSVLISSIDPLFSPDFEMADQRGKTKDAKVAGQISR